MNRGGPPRRKAACLRETPKRAPSFAMRSMFGVRPPTPTDKIRTEHAQTRPPCLLTKARRGPDGPYTGLLPRDMRPQAYAAFAPLCSRPVCASEVAAHPPGDRRANALHLRAVVGSWCQPYSPFAAKRRSSIGRCSVTGRTGARHRLLALQHRRWSEQT